MKDEDRQKNKLTILNSKNIYDLSKNIVRFREKKLFHEWKGKLNEKINFKNKTDDLKSKTNDLHMKVNNILKTFGEKRKRRKNYLYLRNDFDKTFNNFSLSNKSTDIDNLLKSINDKYKKFPLVKYKPKSYENLNLSSLFGSPPPPPIIPPPPPPRLPMEKVNINVDIRNIEDLLTLCETYPLKANIQYNINMKTIHRIKKPLIKLNNMVGMKKLKETIVDQILFFIQKLHYNKNTKESDFMHTVIYGPPGTGKTEIAKIMGEIFSKLDVLATGKFKKVTRADLIAGYLGQTAIKTKEAMENQLGGVLFIDEAYALGNNEKRDSFAKECIDTLCEGLSNHKNNLMVIIAGYEKELEECFFNYNDGLNSRFTWRFHIDDYTPEELKLIFEKKVKDANWTLKKNIKISWFGKNKDYFKFFGRDMETLFAKTKIAHSRRVFCKNKEEKTILTKEDLDKGLKMFLDNEEVQKRKENSEIPFDLYI